MGADAQADAVADEVPQQRRDGPQLVELVEHQADDVAGLLVGIQHQAVPGDAGVPDRGVVEQLAAAGLAPGPGEHPAPQDVQLRLAHDPAQPE